MKKMSNKIKLIILAMTLTLAVPLAVFSQPVPITNDVDTPIDGGLSLLIAAGAVAGAKKINDKRNKK